MLSFLKTCGRGFLVIVSSPLWLLYFALYTVYGLLLFVFFGLRVFISLFSKNRLQTETDFDRKAKAILSNPNFDPRTGVVVSRPDIYPQAPRPYYPPNPQHPPYNSQRPIQPPYDNYDNISRPNSPTYDNYGTSRQGSYPPRRQNQVRRDPTYSERPYDVRPDYQRRTGADEEED